MRQFFAVLLIFLIPCGAAISEEFSWSWDESKDANVKAEGAPAKETEQQPAVPQKAEESAAVPATTAADRHELGESQAAAAVPSPTVEAKSQTPAQPATAAAEVAAESPKGEPAPVMPKSDVSESKKSGRENPRAKGIDTTEYNELVKENLELRKKMAETSQEKDAARKENESLSRQVQELTAKIDEAASKIKEMKKEQAASPDNLDKVVELESQMNKTEAEKNKLAAELAALQTKLTEKEAQPETHAAGGNVKAGSDLFRELQKENEQLKDRLARIESDHENAVKVQEEMLKKMQNARREAALTSEKEKDLKGKLAEAKAAEEESKLVVEKLLDQVPAMERELETLKKDVSAKDQALQEKTKSLEEMKVELEKRERRLMKAERMAAMLDKAREEVGQTSNKEKRDMYYNMAVVYAREGRYEDAEKEYLHALRIDPTDPDVHYNLGILYDEKLHNKAKAALHYRTYLKLNPSAGDADTVKGWLTQNELAQ